jgi:hypothetical protein
MVARRYEVTLTIEVDEPAELARHAARRCLPKDEHWNRWVDMREFNLDPAKADLVAFVPTDIPGCRILNIYVGASDA